MPTVAQPPAKVISLPKPPVPVREFRRKHHLLKWIVAAALLILAAIAGWYWRSYSQNKITYETVKLERGAIQASINATGTLNPVVNVQVGSQVSGNIKALYADFNTKVKQGQLVALIDPRMFQAQVDQASGAAGSAQAAVVTASAQVEKAKADLAGATAGRDNLRAVLAKDKANAVNAEVQWKRSDSLFKQGIVSQQDHDSAKASYDAYQAQLTADQSQIAAAEQSIQSAQAQVNVATTQLSAAQAQLRQARATLEQAQINLEHTRIVAPVSGTVIARHFDVGQTVAASFQAPDIFDIAQDLTQMQVDTNVDESDVGTVAVGQPASFTVDAYPGTSFHGKVIDIRKAPIVTQNVVTYDVVIQVSNPDLKLFPGMTANVIVLTESQADALKVSNAALRFHPSAEVMKKNGLTPAKAGVAQLYVLSGSKMKSVPVKLGVSDGKFTAVSSADLKEGDRVVIRAAKAGGAQSAPTTSPAGPTRRVGF
jgi:HlyD family secretion protein